MAENKKGFMLYADQKSLFDKLPEEIAGKLIKHIFAYVNDENPEANDLLIEIAFEPIKQQLKRDLVKWELRAENSRNNGQLGGRPKKPIKPKKPTRFINNPDEPKKPVIVNDNVTVNDKEINIIIDYLNDKSGKNFKSNTDKTISKLIARFKEGFTIDQFKKVIDIKTTEWLNTDFEKFLRPETLFGNKFEGYLNQQSINPKSKMVY